MQFTHQCTHRVFLKSMHKMEHMIFLRVISELKIFSQWLGPDHRVGPSSCPPASEMEHRGKKEIWFLLLKHLRDAFQLITAPFSHCLLHLPISQIVFEASGSQTVGHGSLGSNGSQLGNKGVLTKKPAAHKTYRIVTRMACIFPLADLSVRQTVLLTGAWVAIQVAIPLANGS